jgi:hypothetical protein
VSSNHPYKDYAALQVLDAWVLAEGRSLSIAYDRAGTRRWLNEAQQKRLEADRNRAEADRFRAAGEDMQRELELLRTKLRER